MAGDISRCKLFRCAFRNHPLSRRHFFRRDFKRAKRGTFVTTQQKDKFTPELRILAASLLSMAVIILWLKYFGPKPPVTPLQTNKPGATASAPTPADGGNPASHVTSVPAKPGATASLAPPVAVSAKNDTQERSVVFENDLYRVQISNRGAVVKSW